MKKLWLFPMIFFILILLAGYFRWAEGPLQSTGDYQILHLKDTWTGQRWVVLFGGLVELSGTGKVEPYPLHSSTRIPYITQEELNAGTQAVLERSAYQTMWRALDRKITELEAQAKSLGLRIPPLPEEEDEMISQSLAEAVRERDTMFMEAKTVYFSEYMTVAKRWELVAKILWVLLLLLTFSFAFHYFLAEVKRWKRANETYEIVEYVTKNNRYPLEK
jgi:hypothetical protein